MTSILNFSTHTTRTSMKPAIVNTVNINQPRTVNDVSKLQTIQKLNRIVKQNERTKTREVTIPVSDYDGIEIIEPNQMIQTQELKNIETDSKQETEQLETVPDVAVTYEQNETGSNQQTEQNEKETVLKLLQTKSETLETFIGICKNQNEFRNKKIILTESNFGKLVSIITGTVSDNIVFRLDEEVGCFCSGSIRRIDSITIQTGTGIIDFKTGYPDEYVFLKLLDIDMKRIRIE